MTIAEKVKRIFTKTDEAKPFRAWLYMLAAALVSMLVVYLPFLVRGTYVVWTTSAGDAATQGVTFLKHVKETGWLKAVGSYDFYLGLGADYLTSYSFFSLFDPFNIFFFILPFGDLMNYTLTMLLKHLAMGCVMFTYLKYKEVANSKSIALSLAYMFTGFIAFTIARHYNLTAGPIYFPLAIMGIEKIFKGERPFLFIAAIFLCLVTNFYMFFSLSVFVVAFAIGYYFHDAYVKGEKYTVGGFFKKLVPAGCFYLLGVALAGVMLAPNLYGYMNAARSASKGLVFFEFEVFLTQALTLTLPIPGKNYSSMYINFALAVLALYALFKKNKNTRIYSIFVVVLTIGFLVPVFGYAMNIFNYSNNRWSYGLSFFIFALIGIQSKEPDGEDGYEEEISKKINISFVVYVAALAIAALPALFSYMALSPWLYLIGLPVGGAVVFFAYKLIKKIKANETPNALKRVYSKNAMFALSVVLTVAHCFGFYCVYCFQHNGAERYGDLFSAEETYVSALNENESFRTDTRTSEDWYYSFSNRGVNNKYYGTSAYNSVSNKYVYEFFKENGVYNPAQNIGISGLDGRFALQTLLSVRYSYDLLGTPYGFTKSEQGENLYENTNYTGMGFVTDKTYSREYYLSLDTLSRQYLLLDGVVLENGEGNADGAFALAKESVTLGENVRFERGKNKKLSYTIDNAKDYLGKELYIVVNDVAETEGLTFFDVKLNGMRKEYYYATKGNLMYSEQRSAYINFGVHTDESVEKLEISIEMTSGPSLSFRSAELCAVAVEQPQIAQSLETFKGLDCMTDIKTGRNSFSGKLNASKDGYAVVTLPYTEGWTAYVDGKETEILKADTAFMALKVTAGEHDIELRYETPYFSLGKLVSYGAAGALAVLIVADTVYRIVKKKRKENNV